jgi:hypothetical protein
MIGRGQIKGKGVVEPELAIPPEEYLRELTKFRFNIELITKMIML